MLSIETAVDGLLPAVKFVSTQAGINKAKCRLFVNLETSEKIYKGDEHMCPMDGYVCFHNSELVCGRLGKATLGGGNKSSLFQVSIHPSPGLPLRIPLSR